MTSSLRKVFSLLAVALICSTASAETTITINVADSTQWTASQSGATTAGNFNENFVISQSGATVTVTPSAYVAANQIWSSSASGNVLRVFDGFLYVDAVEGQSIRKVTFTAKTWVAGFEPNTGSFTDASTKGKVWEGNATRVEFYNGTGKTNAIQQIDIVIDEKNSETVTPDATSSLTELANIAAFNALSDGDRGLLTLSDAVVTAVQGDSAVVEDASGAAIIYYKPESPTFAVGDKLNGTIAVTMRHYNKLPFIGKDYSVDTWTLTSAASEAESDVLTVSAATDAIGSNYLLGLTTVKGLTVSSASNNSFVAADETGELTIYPAFLKTTLDEVPAAGRTVNVTGILYKNGTALRLAPRSSADVEVVDTVVVIPASGILGLCPSRKFTTKESHLLIAKTNTGAQATRNDISYTIKDFSAGSVASSGAVMLIGKPGEHTLLFTDDNVTANIPTSNAVNADGKPGETASVNVPKQRALYELVTDDSGASFKMVYDNTANKTAYAYTGTAGKYYMTMTSSSLTNIKKNAGLSSLDEIAWHSTTPGIATIGASGYATYADSYHALDYSSVSGLTAYKVTAISAEGVATLEAVTTAVPAGTPLLLKGTAGTLYDIPFANDEGEAVSGNLLKAAVVATSKTAATYPAWPTASGDYYINTESATEGFTRSDGDKKFVYVTQAYLSADTASVTTAETITFSEETGIESVSATPTTAVSGAIYNLNGQQVGEGYRGIIIRNGRKAIRR